MHPHTATATEATPTPDRPSPPAAPLSLVPRAERPAALAATVDAAVERLAAQLAEGHSQEFTAVLAFMAKFHRYSATNCLLILAQRPEATMAAGMKRWNRLGYRVRA